MSKALFILCIRAFRRHFRFKIGSAGAAADSEAYGGAVIL